VFTFEFMKSPFANRLCAVRPGTDVRHNLSRYLIRRKELNF
jgi:hypothetical protein